MSDEIGGRSGSQKIRDPLFAAERRVNRVTPELYEFGPFRLEPPERKLLRGNEVVVLTPKAFDLLVLLVRNSGHLIEKEELIRVLWPDTFVEEGNLSNNIFLLRKALGEDPPYIETVPKRGYRFAGAVRQLPNAVPLRPEKRSARTRLRRRVVIFSGLFLAVLVLLISFDVGGWRQRLLNRSGPPKIQSLAVLPLTNLSGDPQQEYFADGMTEELITELSRIGALKVISRTSVTQYKGAKKPLPQIARELGVDAIITGSVEREGGRVRITAQLVEGSSDRNLWAESYQRDLHDVLDLQDEVAQAITREIGGKLNPRQQSHFAVERRVNPESYDAYLRGNAYLNNNDLQKSVDYFNQAIKLDPDYAPSYAASASAYYLLGVFNVLPPSVAFGKMKDAALRALEKDESLPGGHHALGLVKLHYDWDWDGAEKEFKRALELNPNDAETHHNYAHFLMAMGRLDESVAESDRAVELDPVDNLLAGCLCWHRYAARQYTESIAQALKTIHLGTNDDWTYVILGWDYEQVSKFDDAIAQFQKAVKLSNGGSYALAALGHAFAAAGKKQQAQEVLAKLKDRARHGYVSAYDIAVIYTGLGDKEKAFQWLQKAIEERSSLLIHSRWEPRLDPLRSDPRFQDLMHRIGFPQ